MDEGRRARDFRFSIYDCVVEVAGWLRILTNCVKNRAHILRRISQVNPCKKVRF